VSALGGKVVVKGGSSRVMGLLAMTRAIGDHFLRPYVIPEPEVRHSVLACCQGVAFNSGGIGNQELVLRRVELRC
jgi:hypothetical protein